MSRYLFLILFSIFAIPVFAQDTLQGFSNKISGEDIIYFSPLHRFADKALLTRANGSMPVSVASPLGGNSNYTVYQFLIGHSSGTSGADRKFNISLNDSLLFVLTTPRQKKGEWEIHENFPNGVAYSFSPIGYDINGDAFGYLFIQVPSVFVSKKASFQFFGPDQQSRDWLMVFDYRCGLRIEPQPSALVQREANRRQLNVYIDNPYPSGTVLSMTSSQGAHSIPLVRGYNVLHLPFSDPDFSGPETLKFIIGTDTLFRNIEVQPAKPIKFALIHHSHNDIGYSHLQTEVERIQTENIKSALRWTSDENRKGNKAFWHIESLWALENFLRNSTDAEKAHFFETVRSGRISLSANYANVLTGLCRREEQDWNTEYARRIGDEQNFNIGMAMITDIPGIKAAALQSYAKKGIRYLSIGANYVENLPDKGDRVGGVIRELGDRPFYWKASPEATEKVLVWHAGKGYSYFHAIASDDKQAAWESRISAYCDQLTATGYPYDIVQLRYTQHADNGPVDTNLITFVNEWNRRFSSPRLEVYNLDSLFLEFESKYGSQLPIRHGEISPYWEDGAYSTTKEEVANRELAQNTIQMETWAKANGNYQRNKKAFEQLHRDIVMFHEHTWGSWCSISDPDLPFTVEQWNYKKAFLDSGLFNYRRLADQIGYKGQTSSYIQHAGRSTFTDFEVDLNTGGLISLTSGNHEWMDSSSEFKLLQPLYSTGIEPVSDFTLQDIKVVSSADDMNRKKVVLSADLQGFKKVTMSYELDKLKGELMAVYTFNKLPVREKESLHLAIPLSFKNPVWKYGDDSLLIEYGKDQLPGSNYDFICAEEKLICTSAEGHFTIQSSGPNLFEIGDRTNEKKIMGAKKWRSHPVHSATAFLYVLNNYWHTNYKADQEGEIDFTLRLSGIVSK